MINKTILVAFSLFLLIGCQSAYYSAMEKVGTHKRDILIDRVEEATSSQEEAKEEFISALEQLSKLINFDGGELQTQYDLSKDSFDSSNEAAQEVSARINSIEDVAEALFDEWRDEIDQYSSQSLKRQSKLQLNTTEKRYLTVINAMHKAEDKMLPILSALKDNMLYLKHNLNAKAIGALKGEYKIIKQDINRLIIQMNKSIEDSQAFIATLKST
jgi:hypothetical protein